MQNPFRFRRASVSRNRRRSLTRLAFAVLVSALSLPLVSPRAQAGNYYWDPLQSNVDPGSGGPGTWNTTSLFWKLQGTSGDVAWTNVTTNTSEFAGTAGTVTLGSAITTGGLTFDTAGYTLNTSTFTLTLGGNLTTTNTTGKTTISGTVSTGVASVWTVAAGGTLQFDAGYSNTSSLSITSNGTTNITGSFAVTGKSTLTGTGTYNLSGTENFNSAADNYNGIQGATLNNTAGTATFNGNVGNGVFIGNTASASQGSTLNVTGGTVNVTNTRLFIGDGFSGVLTTAGDGTVNVGGGSGTATFNTGTGTLTAALGNNVATGTINLNTNGVLASNRAWTAGTSGKGIINFNGGTLQALGVNLGIVTGVTTNVAENGGTIDANTFAISLAATITHGGTATTDGGLTIKAGTGSVTLTANNSYNGPTLVSTGVLLANGAGVLPLSTSAVTVTNGANVAVGDHAGGSFQTMTNGFTLNGTGKSVSAIQTNALSGAGALGLFNSGGFSLTGNMNLASSALIYDNPATQTGNITFSGVISGVGGLTLAGAGSASGTAVNLALSNANTYGTTSATTQFTNFTGSPQMTVTLSTVNNVLPTNTVLTLGGVPTGQGGTYNGNVNVSLGGINQTVAGLTTGGTTGVYRIIGNSATLSNLTVNNSTAYTFGGVIGSTGTNNNNLALIKTGTGTLTLTGLSTYTGGTTINGGALALDFNATTTPTNILPSASSLTMSGGTLNVLAKSGTATSQTVNGLTLNSGGSSISVSPAATNPNSVVLNLGAISRNAGSTINFTLPSGGQNNTYGITTTSANTATSILGGWATAGLNDWAVSGGNGLSTAGNITALSTYFVSDNVTNLAANTAGPTSNVTDSNGYNASYTASITINSLRFNASASDSNFGLANSTLTLNSGGILVTNNVGAKYQRIGFLNTNFNANEGQGIITLGAPGDLVINQNNSAGGHLEIYSKITGTGVNLVKSGVGYFELRGLDADYTGNTVVNGGTMLLTAATTGTSNVTINNGTLLLGANDRINNTATVTLAGGTLNLGAKSEGAAGTSGVGALTLASTSTLDFGTTGSGNLIQFAGVGTHTAGALLQVADWEGTSGGANGTDRLLFAGTSTDFTAAYSQSDVSFNGVSGYGVTSFGGYYEVFGIVAVPEPATWGAGALLLGAAGWSLRRRAVRRSAGGLSCAPTVA